MKSYQARVAINGFGRIGRLFFRVAFERKGFDVVAVNDLGDAENLAYLLKYDTVYGRYQREIKNQKSKGKNYLRVGRKKVLFLGEKDPARLPWKKLGVDVAVEATGAFESFAAARAHLAAGAKRVVLTAPAKDGEQPDAKTVLLGVNDEEFKRCRITSNGSCTTNAAHPVAAILAEKPGIKKAILGTVHGYTATQNLVDGPVRGKDYRRGRAAAMNIAPSSTGAAIAVTRALRALDGKFDGVAFRVPIATGSLVDFTFVAKRKTSVAEVNGALKKAAASPRWKNILKVTEDPIVSSDVIGEPYGAVVDLAFTKVVDGDLVKVLSWYDNEMGYAAVLAEHVARACRAL